MRPYQCGSVLAGVAFLLCGCSGPSDDGKTLELAVTNTNCNYLPGTADSIQSPMAGTSDATASRARGALAYALSEYDNAINVIDTSTKSVIFTVTAPGSLNRPHRGWVHPSQKRLYVSNKPSSLPPAL